MGTCHMCYCSSGVVQPLTVFLENDFPLLGDDQTAAHDHDPNCSWLTKPDGQKEAWSRIGKLAVQQYESNIREAYVSKYYWIAMGEFTFELAWAFAALEVISLGITRFHRLLLDSASLSFCVSKIL